MGQGKLDDAVPDDADGGFLGNGALIAHHSRAAGREYAAVDDGVRHQRHLLSRRVDKPKWIGEGQISDKQGDIF